MSTAAAPVAAPVDVETIAEVSAGTPATETAIILGGGGYFHANTNAARTQSGHELDVDGRTGKCRRRHRARHLRY